MLLMVFIIKKSLLLFNYIGPEKQFIIKAEFDEELEKLYFLLEKIKKKLSNHLEEVILFL